MPIPAEEAANPPTIILKNGVLTIQANNSDLREILKQVADVSGMAIDGPIANSRVYGDYGPSDPREVLTTLLTGSGYNFVMTGATKRGTPGELQLTAQNGVATAAAPLVPGATVAASDNHPQQDEKAQTDDLAPGVIAHVPPPPSEDPQERVRQNLNRLQQMRDPQSQQNSPQ